MFIVKVEIVHFPGVFFDVVEFAKSFGIFFEKHFWRIVDIAIRAFAKAFAPSEFGDAYAVDILTFAAKKMGDVFAV